MILAQVLQDHIRERKTTMRSLATEIGIKHNNLWRILHGENTRADNVMKIIAWMLQDKPRKNGKSS